ncbi:hypothetical protein EON83_28540 [bacterium]|nr:MAG: hypothetical protein EON83_28540 [bacterium]
MADKNEIEPEESQEPKEGEGEIPTLSVRLTRVVRTQSSEVYLLWDEDARVGQVDVHYGPDLIHATLILEREFSAEQQADIVDQIDQDVVASHLPRFGREDFLVTVFQGRELEPFSDGPDEEDFDEEEDY